eukprot:TRINITY_DN266_c0_g1_i2.p1 TRINITY_DN266_c0_g1~~TRINITY_DN266_c0_g1_i2.p1  ORF type:complete len:632 (+),score=99.63 TRINITY_DN266_c0_g1_i2:203-2098(+)
MSQTGSNANWETKFLPSYQYNNLYYGDGFQSFTPLVIGQDIFLQPSSIQSIAREFLNEEDVWMVYRHGSMKVQCELKGSFSHLFNSPTSLFYICENSVDGLATPTFYPVKTLSLLIHMTRDLPSTQTNSSQSEIPTLVQKFYSSHKTEFVQPNMVQIFPPLEGQKSSVEWTKLQFSASTSGNGKSKEFKEYFHLVISLVAIFDTYVENNPTPIQNSRMIMSVVAPPFIVIGQNPSRFKRSRNSTSISVSSSNDHTNESSSNVSPSSSSPSNSTPQISHSNSPNPSVHTESHQESQNFWSQSDSNTIFRYGAVGINMPNPPEALSVGGNILVGGNIMKPSDMRIKENIVKIDDTAVQLDNIKKLKVYDYQRAELGGETQQYTSERGVLAQELKTVLPNAVKVVGDVCLPNGKVIPNLLVVDDRVLLFENIGATQELGKVLDNVTEHTNENTRLIEKISSIVNTIAKDEKKRPSRFLLLRLNVLGLGPAWSLTILGFFLWPFWGLGACFLHSDRWIRQVSGFISLVLFGISLLINLFVKYNGTVIQPIMIISLQAIMWVIGCHICALVLCGTKALQRKKKKRAEANLIESGIETENNTTQPIQPIEPTLPTEPIENPPPPPSIIVEVENNQSA